MFYYLAIFGLTIYTRLKFNVKVKGRKMYLKIVA